MMFDDDISSECIRDTYNLAVQASELDLELFRFLLIVAARQFFGLRGLKPSSSTWTRDLSVVLKLPVRTLERNNSMLGTNVQVCIEVDEMLMRLTVMD
jgi:hypothetical protein